MKLYCPGFDDETNGMAVVAKLMAGDLQWRDERIVHGAWLVGSWWACLRFGRYLRMPHGSYDPVRLAYHGWKKRLVGPIERFFLRRASKVLVTCAAEANWVRAYEPRVKAVEVVDVKRYFGLEAGAGVGVEGGVGRGACDARRVGYGRGLNVLYLGRRHPLKGVECLEQAVLRCNQALSQGKQANGPTVQQSSNLSIGQLANRPIDLRIVSNARGEEKERVWEWCDVLCLPTLSENFGLVVAEALARGKRVIVTDGAPVWENESDGGRLTYVKGYRDGTDETRVALLAAAFEALFDSGIAAATGKDGEVSA